MIDAAITHLTPAGAWDVCEQEDVCPFMFHFPGVTPAEMAAVPERVLWALCEVVDPPTAVFDGVLRCWGPPDELPAKAHRAYGLPAHLGVDGYAAWYMNGSEHRAGGLPAVIYDNGDMEWRVEGLRHREGDLPALVRADGTLEWYKWGALHREGNKPARVDAEGTQEFRIEGRYARTDGGPVVLYPTGYIEFLTDGRWAVRQLLPLRDLRAQDGR